MAKIIKVLVVLLWAAFFRRKKLIVQILEHVKNLVKLLNKAFSLYRIIAYVLLNTCMVSQLLSNLF